VRQKCVPASWQKSSKNHTQNSGGTLTDWYSPRTWMLHNSLFLLHIAMFLSCPPVANMLSSG